jgi:hypothetical protein
MEITNRWTLCEMKASVESDKIRHTSSYVVMAPCYIIYIILSIPGRGKQFFL